MGSSSDGDEIGLNRIHFLFSRSNETRSGRMRRFLGAAILLALFALLVSSVLPRAYSAPETASCTLRLKLDGAVSPGWLDYMERGRKRATEENCSSIVLEVNTPGGNLQTTREIVTKILESRIPFLCLISPSGGHAGSAGALIILACHVSGAEPATSLGAATPIAGTGQNLDEDLRKKVVGDTASWIRGLANRRDRDATVAEKFVTEALVLEADKAVEAKVVDTLAGDLDQFLRFAEGRNVRLAGDERDVVRVGALVSFEPDLRSRVLGFVTDPQVAYFLFMASLALLYLEFSSPGAIAPGVAGVLGLVLSLVSFHHLDVFWGGALLIALGVLLLIIEAFVPSFGVLGIGGIAALGFGSFLLYDPAVIGWRIPIATIVYTCAVLSATVFALGLFVIRTRKTGRARAEVALLDKVGEVASLEAPSLRKGMVIVAGEYWKFVSDEDVHTGDRVLVLGHESGLVLKVSKKLPDPNGDLKQRR